jgi:hypothetical protein
MVALLIVALFVSLAVLSVLFGADSRQHSRQTDWPFHPRP